MNGPGIVFFQKLLKMSIVFFLILGMSNHSQLKLLQRPNCGLHGCLSTWKQPIQQPKFSENIRTLLYRKLWACQKSYHQNIESMNL